MPKAAPLPEGPHVIKRLAALTSRSFDSRGETDSVICTAAQTCAATAVPTVWLRKARLGTSLAYALGPGWRAAGSR